jgi:hypothetical protein
LSPSLSENEMTLDSVAGARHFFARPARAE